MAQLKQAAAEVKAWDHVLTLDPRSADDPLSGRALGMPFDPVVIGCRSHGNVLVTAPWLRTVAKEQRKVACDPQAQRV